MRAPYKVEGNYGILRDKDGVIVGTFAKPEDAAYFAEVMNSFEESSEDIKKMVEEEQLKTELL